MQKVCWIALLLALAGTPGAAGASVSIENGQLRVVVDEATGAVVSLYNKARHLEWVREPARAPSAVRVVVQGGQAAQLERWRVQKVVRAGRQRLEVEGRGAKGLVVRWVVELRGEAPEAGWRITKMEAPAGLVEQVDFPVLGGLDGPGPEAKWLGPDGRLERAPDGWEIAYPAPETVQFMACYAPGRGGFYLAAYDWAGGAKRFVFQRREQGAEVSVQTKVGGARRYMQEYFSVVAPLARGDWYEAAEQYKAWAEGQAWCRREQTAGKSQGEGASKLEALTEPEVSRGGAYEAQSRAKPHVALFNYIYHEFAPVRVVKASGEELLQAAGRAFCEGAECAVEGDLSGLEARFLKETAVARVKLAREYVVEGRQAPRPEVQAPEGVEAACWVSKAGRLGVVLANTGRQAAKVELELAPGEYTRYGLAKGALYEVTFARKGLFEVVVQALPSAGGKVVVELPGLSVGWGEVRASKDGAREKEKGSDFPVEGSPLF